MLTIGVKGEEMRGGVNPRDTCGKIQPQVYPRFIFSRRYPRHHGWSDNSKLYHIRNTKVLRLNIDWRHVGLFPHPDIHLLDLLGPLGAATALRRTTEGIGSCTPNDQLKSGLGFESYTTRTTAPIALFGVKLCCGCIVNRKNIVQT